MQNNDNNLSPTQKKALEVLKRNDRGTFSLPTHGLYPVQFNWDSAFAALGYQYIDSERAWAEVFQLASSQWADGMIPHIMFRGDHEGYFPGPDVWDTGQFIPTSGITQPPVLASVARTLDSKQSSANLNAMHNFLSRLVRWHDWFMQARLEPQSQGIVIIHPWESGRDNLTDWDTAMARVVTADLPPYQRRDLEHVDNSQRPTKEQYDRYLTLVKFGRDRHWPQTFLGQHSPFRMVDPGMTAMLLRANRDLLVLLEKYNGKDEQQTENRYAKAITSIKQHITTLEQGWRNLWNSKVNAYTAYDPVEAKHCDSVSACSFLHAYAGVVDEAEHAHTMDHFDRIAKAVKYTLPSFDPEHPHFDAKRYWRGPVWHVINNRVGMGLSEVGEAERAERIQNDTRLLTEEHGLFEYFDPLTGEGLGGNHFTWTAAVYLDWVAPPTVDNATGRD